MKVMEFPLLSLCYTLHLFFHIASTAPFTPDDELQIDLSEYGTRLFGSPKAEVGHNVREWSNSKEESPGNVEELGSYLEGDLLIPIGNSTKGRNGMVAESYRWTDGIIPFEITGSFNAFAMDLIEKAINAYHENTCIKFVPRRSSDRDYISIQSDTSGCWSSVGRIGSRQMVNLQTPGCTSKVGTVIHEFMHTVGFLHEQNREERDSFVTVMYSNIRKGYEANFHKAAAGTTSGFGVGYDYGSVMHYSENAFSVNGQPTIVTKVICNLNIFKRNEVNSFFFLGRIERQSDKEKDFLRKTLRKYKICINAK